jgi:16S rRNA (adenine1518-N6/adenine1519-N6)-dimethyltransferase
MTIINQIKNELDQLGIKPKKGMGQNFLVNEGVYKKLVSALELRPDDTVIEVGPGLGTLTELLAASGATVIAIEKDDRLSEYLRSKFENQKNVKIRNEDILEFDTKTQDLAPNTYKLAGNIPYYLTSRLLKIVFENWPRPELLVLMLQKEVAQRICAKPPKMSLLAVSVQYYSEPKAVSYVSRGSFYPAPEVDSAIIKLTTKELRSREGNSTKNFFKVVKSGFAKKRKQLVNNLATGLKIAKSEIESKLTTAGIDPRRRAETLIISEWQKITDTFFSQE